MANILRVESQDDDVFCIKSVDDDSDVCSVVFDSDMGGALEYRERKVLITKLAEAIEKVCKAYWNNQN